MVLDKARPASERILRPLVEKIGGVGIRPNHLTILAFISAIIAGVLFFFSHFVLGGIMIAVNGILDALDGELARCLEISSRRGDLLDHALDRYADVAILIGLSFSSACIPWLGLIALLSVLLGSYMGTQAQAVGVGRIYSGILGRADRLVLLIFIPIIYGIWHFSFYGISLIEATMIYFIVGGNLTAAHRFYLAWKDLKAQEGGK